MRLPQSGECVQPDGACHSLHALVYGCDNEVPPGQWACDEHHVEAYRAGQELKAERERKARPRSYQGGAPETDYPEGRDRTASSEKTASRVGWS